MRYLLFLPTLFILFAPLTAGAVTGGSARFDWTLGQPAITDNQTSLCTGTATVMYAWSLGQPAQVFDATATCTAAGAGTPASGPAILYLKNADFRFKDGDVRVKE